MLRLVTLSLGPASLSLVQLTLWSGPEGDSAFRTVMGLPAGTAALKTHIGRRFAAALLVPRLFGTNPRSHQKGATGRVRTGNQRLPVLCHCQLGQDISITMEFTSRTISPVPDTSRYVLLLRLSLLHSLPHPCLPLSSADLAVPDSPRSAGRQPWGQKIPSVVIFALVFFTVKTNVTVTRCE